MESSRTVGGLAVELRSRARCVANQIAELQNQLETLGVESAELGFEAGVIGRPRPVVKSLKLANKAIQSVAKADPSNIQEVAASQLDISNSYYQSVLDQARQSFRSAIIAGAIGFAFFLAAVAFVLAQDEPDAAIISAISGGIAQAIAGLNFWLYGRTAQQLDAFHIRLEQTQRFLLANSVCENLESAERDAARANLVTLIATHTATSPEPHQ